MAKLVALVAASVHSFASANPMRADEKMGDLFARIKGLFNRPKYVADEKAKNGERAEGVDFIGWNTLERDGIARVFALDSCPDAAFSIENAIRERSDFLGMLQQQFADLVPTYLKGWYEPLKKTHSDLQKSLSVSTQAGELVPIAPQYGAVNANSRIRGLVAVFADRADFSDFRIISEIVPFVSADDVFRINLLSNDDSGHTPYTLAGYVAAAVRFVRQGKTEAEVGRLVGIKKRGMLQKVYALATAEVMFPSLRLLDRSMMAKTTIQVDKKEKPSYLPSNWVSLESLSIPVVRGLCGRKEKGEKGAEVLPAGYIADVLGEPDGPNGVGSTTQWEKYFAYVVGDKPKSPRWSVEQIADWASKFAARTDDTGRLVHALLSSLTSKDGPDLGYLEMLATAPK